MWDVSSGAPLHNFSGHSGRVMCCLWHPTRPGLVITGSEDTTLHIWDPKVWRLDRGPPGRSVISRNIRISPDSYPLRGRKRRSPNLAKTSEARSLGLLAGRSFPLTSCWLSIDLSGPSPSQQRSLPCLRTGRRVWTRLSEEDTFWRRGEIRRANLLRTRTCTSQYPVRLKPGEKLTQQRIV